LFVGPAAPGGSCPTLTPGETFTLISTSGSLAGSFANAPEEGPETPVSFAKACTGSAQTVRIRYHREGVTRTVTATVEAGVVEAQEAAAKRREEEAKAQKTQEEEAATEKQRAAEAAATKLREELAQIQASVKRVNEEAATSRQHE